jgi:hypothetical protein
VIFPDPATTHRRDGSYGAASAAEPTRWIGAVAAGRLAGLSHLARRLGLLVEKDLASYHPALPIEGGAIRGEGD